MILLHAATTIQVSAKYPLARGGNRNSHNDFSFSQRELELDQMILLLAVELKLRERILLPAVAIET
jgi:hypothetical protein